MKGTEIRTVVLGASQNFWLYFNREDKRRPRKVTIALRLVKNCGCLECFFHSKTLRRSKDYNPFSCVEDSFLFLSSSVVGEHAAPTLKGSGDTAYI